MPVTLNKIQSYTLANQDFEAVASVFVQEDDNIKLGMQHQTIANYNTGCINSVSEKGKIILDTMKDSGYITKEDYCQILGERGRPLKNPKPIKGKFIIRRTEKFFSKLNEIRNKS